MIVELGSTVSATVIGLKCRCSESRVESVKEFKIDFCWAVSSRWAFSVFFWLTYGLSFPNSYYRRLIVTLAYSRLACVTGDGQNVAFQMLVRKAFCLKVEWKRAIVGMATCLMECNGLFSISTHELKTLLHVSPNVFSWEEIWHLCLTAVVKDMGKVSETITGRNICKAFKIFRVFRWECSHRYRYWL